MLDEGGVGGELSPSHPTCIDGVNVFGIGLEPPVFDDFGFLNQRFDLRAGAGICGAMARTDESVIRILPRTQGAHAIQFAKQYGREQMIDGVGIVRMTRQNLRKLLDRPLIIHVVEVIESGRIERIGGAE